MKSFFKNAAMFMAMAALTAGAVSCSDDNDTVTGSDDSQAAAIAEQFVDHTVAPTYGALAAKTEQLAAELAALKANPNDAALRGLAPLCSGHADRLHDCRARNVIEAIMWHGSAQSDARRSVVKFRQLSKADRDAVVKFINAI